MKRRSRLILPLAAFSLLFGVVASVTACGNQQQTGNEEKITITAEGNKKALILGETVQLSASVEGVTWSSSEESVATVNATGLVQSIAVGKATIKANKKGYKEGTFNISVDLPKITITPSSGSVKMYETVQLQASEQGVTWSSSDEKIATVSSAGVVTGVYVGTAQISASKDGFNAGKATITVTRQDALATLSFDDADHYSYDGWWGTADEGYLPYYDRSSGNASGGKCLAHFGAGDKETLTFTSNNNVNAELVIMMAASSAIDNMQSVMVAQLNGQAIDLTDKSFAGGSTSEFTEFSLGNQQIKKDQDNVLMLEFAADSGTPYIDDLMLYAKDAPTGTVVTTKKAPERERITTADETIAAYIDTDNPIVLSKPTSLDGVSFESDKEEVATVTQAGVVRGIKLGSANITIKKNGWISARVKAVVDKKGEPGEIRVQAEDIDPVPDGFHKYTDSTSGIQNGHYGGAYITGYDVNSETTLSYTFNSPSAQTMKLIIAGAPHYQMSEAFVFATDCTITLNGGTVTPGADAQIAPGSTMGAATVEVEIGIVNVKAGDNTFTIVFHSKAPALDAFRFIPVS